MPNVVITAEDAGALTSVCGISILERLVRILQRLDVRDVTIFAADPEKIREHVAQPSWARANLRIRVCALQVNQLTAADLASDTRLAASDARTLVLSAGYFDARVLAALMSQGQTTIVIDSAPSFAVRPLLPPNPSCAAAVVQAEWLRSAARDSPLFSQLSTAAEQRKIAAFDLAEQPSYIASMRRSIRPVCFPPPTREHVALAERLVLDTAQNGTLDLPAIVHGPIETWIVARLCRTAITPNQITLFTAAVSLVVVALFAAGHLIAGTLLALGVGVLDGLDGKQARVKVETTPLGQREHALDYVLELSWWTGLAHYFASSGKLHYAYALLILLVASDVIDRLAKRHAKAKTGRNLDDIAPLDRFVRLVGGRRNIYVWMFACGLLLHAADKAFVALCCWGALTAAVHAGRAIWIGWQHSIPGAERAPQ